MVVVVLLVVVGDGGGGLEVNGAMVLVAVLAWLFVESENVSLSVLE